MSVAPLVPFVADDVYQHSHEVFSIAPKVEVDGKGAGDVFVAPIVNSTVFDASWPSASSLWCNERVSNCFAHVLDVQSKVGCVDTNDDVQGLL